MMPDLLSALGRALAQCTRAKHKHRCGAQADGARLRIVFAKNFGKAKIWVSCECNGSFEIPKDTPVDTRLENACQRIYY